MDKQQRHQQCIFKHPLIKVNINLLIFEVHRHRLRLDIKLGSLISP